MILVNQQLPHHCVVPGQRFNTQTPPYGPRTCVSKLRHMLVHAPLRGARMLSGEPLFYYGVG